MNYPEKLINLLKKLIQDSKTMIKAADESSDYSMIPEEMRGKLRLWYNELVLFKSISSDLIKPWDSRLAIKNGTIVVRSEVVHLLAVLETILFAFNDDLLSSYRDLIYSEVHSDLLQQGQGLLEQNYVLAAGVIFRAVLEEKLCKLCESNSCQPSKEHPTLNDYNIALYKHTPPVYSKSMMQNIAALTAVGNDAAHNKPDLKFEDVKRLENGLLDFLARY